MVSPSKTKHSRVAANQHQKTANASKVKLVKGPTPLVHHRFYLDIQKHQLASKIEAQIKELGGHIEFFLSKEITHFITDKDYSHGAAGQDPDGGPSNLQPLTPTTPLTPKTPLSSAHLHHLQQYVNEASPSSPSCVTNGFYGTAAHSHHSVGPGSVGAGPGAHTFGGSESRSTKPAAPRSRADAMLQRVRQAQQQQSNHHQNSPIAAPYNLLAGRATSRPCSPCSPAPTPAPSAAIRLDRNSQSPAQLAKSWGKPIWSTDQAIKFLGKVSGSCKQGAGQQEKGETAGEQTPKVVPQILRADYIKIESYQRHHYRPAFHVFKAWPTLNLNTKSNHSPFDSARGGRSVQPSVPAAGQAAPVPEDRVSVKTTATTNQTNATTTTTTNKQEETQQQAQCGYCEICRIEYDVLANHLNADEHRAFVRNDGNFEALDKLISDGGVSLGTFLSGIQQEPEEADEQTTSEPSCVPTSESTTSNSVFCEPTKDTVEGGQECDDPDVVEVQAKKRKLEEATVREETTYTVTEQAADVAGQLPEVTKPLKTYSRKGNNTPTNQTPDSLQSTVPAKRTYAGRKPAKNAAQTAAVVVPAPPLPVEPDPEPEPDQNDDDDASNAQMFGRRSAIHHHPHNTLNHHNHQKAKAARQAALEQQQQQKEQQEAIVDEVVMKLHADGGERNQTKRHAADRMGMKQSSIKSPTAAVLNPATAAELMECEGLDPKNTKRISLGLRQNPKRANLNEDFTSLLDETLGPMRKPRIRRESAKRVNYSEPREDEIASQEELIESILLESTAQEAAAAAAAEESCRGKKKTGSPKRPSDVKIRGIRWRAPSPHARPPVKSPLLYKVIEDPKPKSRKNNTTSPTKDSVATGSPTKATKNGLIVKIRRVRQSELSLLNDEAENFMFPKKDDSSDEDTDEDRQTSSETGPGDYSQEVPSSDYDHRNSSIRKSAGTPIPHVKKRLPGRPPATDSPSKKAAKELPLPTPADQDQSTPRSRRVGNRGAAALLHDNAEYYKFPDPGSRLRFPEAPIQPNPEVEDDEVMAALMTPPPAPPPLRKRGRKPANHATAAAAAFVAPATVTSSAERRQQQDLLLATRVSPGSPYQHQEQLTSCGKAIINYVNKGKEDGMGAMFKWSTFVRNCQQIEPYRFAFERVPSLEPWYETFQRQDEASEKMYEYFGNTAYRKLPYEMGGLPPLRQNCCILNYRMKSKTPESTVPSSSNSSTCDGATSNPSAAASAKPSSSSSEPLSLPLKKRKLLVDSDRPRKSPREHASTLAILSLLHQQQQHNRRRTISGSSASGVPLVTTANLPPPSPVGYSPKKVAIQQQQEADSALGDEIRSSCGSDPVTEKDEPMAATATTASNSNGAKKIKFDPPIMPEGSFVDYKSMCQQLEDFLCVDVEEQLELPVTVQKTTAAAMDAPEPLKQNLLQIVQACDKEPPLSLKLVSRHESIVRKIVQYDRKPRPLSAISIKSFDGGGGGGGPGGTNTPGSGFSLGIFKKRINRTGWPNVKKRIVTRRQQQQKGNKRDSAEGGEASVKKEEPPAVDDASRKSSTEESQVSSVGTATSTVVAEGDAVKQELVVEDGEEPEIDDDDDDDEDEFEDTMTMLDPEEEPARSNGEAKVGEREQLLTDDEEEDEEEPEEPPAKVAKKETEESRQTPEPTKTEEILIPSRPCPRSSLPSSKYVTKTTTTMTRIDYNVPSSNSAATTATTPASSVPESGVKSSGVDNIAEECDSISSRSIFVSDDCDTTSSTLINMCAEADPLALPCTPPVDVPPDEPPDDSRSSTPAVVARGRQNNTRHVGPSAGGGGRKRSNLQPIVCLQKINCSAAASAAASSMRTRSSSRTPVKKTYKRSVFTSALVNSAGKPLKKKRKRKKLKLLNGGTVSPPVPAQHGGSSSPSCSDDQNSSTAASSSLDCCDQDPNEDDGRGTDSPSTVRRSSTKNRPPTPSPVKFSPRKLRKPRGRWYRER